MDTRFDSDTQIATSTKPCVRSDEKYVPYQKEFRRRSFTIAINKSTVSEEKE